MINVLHQHYCTMKIIKIFQIIPHTQVSTGPTTSANDLYMNIK
jgi:hypothetical protein